MGPQVPTTATEPRIQQPTMQSAIPQPNEPLQSVYLADKDLIKTYPISLSNGEIDFNIQTEVRGNKPEDFYVNFLPLTQVQQGWKFLQENGGKIFESVKQTPPGQVAGAIGAVLKAEDEYLAPALKLAVTDPGYVFGGKEARPDALQQTYKPWIDLWRESEVGSKIAGFNESFAMEHPVAGFAPWFLTEFIPGELLEFGTKPSNWVGAYGIEKFGPPIINAALSKLPKTWANRLQRDMFKAEVDLKSDFENLGIKPNTKTSGVVAARNSAAKALRPDLNQNIEEWNVVNNSYQKIMESRGKWMDKIFDKFRSAPELNKRANIPTQQPKGVMGILGNERGSALIPFSEGDIIKIGKDVGKVLKVTGEMATINLAGKIVEKSTSELSHFEAESVRNPYAVNPSNLGIEPKAKDTLFLASKSLGEQIENQTGIPLKNEEVIEAAKTADLLTQGVSREKTLEFEASLLRTRQHLAALANQNELTPEFLDTLKIMANQSTDIARSLQSFKIEAMPELATIKTKVISDIIKLGKSSEEIMDAAKGVDFSSEQSVAKFYRQFVKPKFGETLDEFVYMNILSSPLTHIINASSNMFQAAVLNPATKLATGAVDLVAKSLFGVERTHYIKEVPAFYKGLVNAVPEAVNSAVKIMQGKKNIERPDLKHIPTLSKAVNIATLGLGKYVTRSLEASDVFFRTLVEKGEIEALGKRLGRAPDEKELAKIHKQASTNAEYSVFRQKPDTSNATGQGGLLSGIDKMTNAIYELRTVPGMKWFIRFVQTPMNIIKQGIEYSPAGLGTIPGGKNWKEQAGKTIIGSIAFAGGAWLAANNRTTWAAPRGDKDKQEFYAAGLQPYSVRIGDKWVSYSKIGPLAYPLAMASSLHYFMKESPKALSDSEMDKVVDGMTGIMGFFSDQSYMSGLGDLVKFASGEKSKALASVPTQLIPLSSLQGWANNIIDPLQRKAEKGLSMKSVLDNIQMKIVGMSRFVPAQIDSDENQVKKQMREVNAVSPLRISKVNKSALIDYRENVELKQEVNLAKKEAMED